MICNNMCQQPRETMSIYKKMLEEGFTPNATTYNALISAYGKAGQLEKVNTPPPLHAQRSKTFLFTCTVYLVKSAARATCTYIKFQWAEVICTVPMCHLVASLLCSRGGGGGSIADY